MSYSGQDALPHRILCSKHPQNPRDESCQLLSGYLYYMTNFYSCVGKQPCVVLQNMINSPPSSQYGITL